MKKRLLPALLAMCLLLGAAPICGNAAMNAAPFGKFSAENLRNEGVVTEAVFAGADVTLVNFWATWCGPCVGELPHLGVLAEKTEGRVQVLGVLLDSLTTKGEKDDDVVEAMHALMDESGAAFDVVMPDAWLSSIATIVTSIPTTFLVDSQGNIISSVIGARNEAQWLETIEAALTAK